MDLAGDLYPSRRGNARVMARHEPVIASPQAPGPLSPPRLLQYQQDGYLRNDLLFRTAETARIEHAIRELTDSSYLVDRPEVVRAPNGAMRAIYRPHMFSEVLGEVVHDARLVEIAKQILGGSVYIHQARVTFRSDTAAETPDWQSDFELWHVDDGLPRMRTVSIVLGLADYVARETPLQVIPASHRQFVARGRELQAESRTPAPLDDALVEKLCAGDGLIAPVLPRGSLFVVDCNLMVRCASRPAAYADRTLTVVYNSIDNRPHRPYSGLPPRAAHLAEREVVPL